VYPLGAAGASGHGHRLGTRVAQTCQIVSVPILAGALMRFPLGVLSQYIGRKRTRRWSS